MKDQEKEKVVTMFQRLIDRLHYGRAKAIKVIHRETGLDIADIALILSLVCSGVGIDN